LPGPQGLIQDDGDSARGHHGEERRDGVRAVLEQDRDAIVGAEAPSSSARAMAAARSRNAA